MQAGPDQCTTFKLPHSLSIKESYWLEYTTPYPKHFHFPSLSFSDLYLIQSSWLCVLLFLASLGLLVSRLNSGHLAIIFPLLFSLHRSFSTGLLLLVCLVFWPDIVWTLPDAPGCTVLYSYNKNLFFKDNLEWSCSPFIQLVATIYEKNENLNSLNEEIISALRKLY